LIPASERRGEGQKPQKRDQHRDLKNGLRRQP
jgi:hypothetical protein